MKGDVKLPLTRHQELKLRLNRLVAVVQWAFLAVVVLFALWFLALVAIGTVAQRMSGSFGD